MADEPKPDYPASPPGMEVVDIPPPGCGWTVREKVQVGHLGHHIGRQVAGAAAFREAHKVLAHYAGLAEGSGLLDDASLSRLQKLTRGLAAAEDQPGYVKKHVTPFLHGLKVERRAK